VSFSFLLEGFAQHPHLAGLAVFLIALAESLAVIGLLVPGVAMMFAAGALVGAGALPFWPVCAYAVAGAVAGDGLSFWLGWHYRDRLRTRWPFTRYPGLIDRGIAFFHRYGGRSVLIGRFVGPVRAVIPLVAGMLAMPVRRFLYSNIVSALLWGPAYLLPGMAFGASLELASQVTGRLVVLLVALLAVLWFSAWFSRWMYRFFRPRTHRLILATFDLSRRHPLLGRLTAPLMDPRQRDYGGLLVWAALLGGVGLVGCLLVPADLVPVSLEAWRNPWADYALTVVAELGATPAVLVYGAALWGWLLLKEHGLAAAHLAGAVGFAVVLGEGCAALFPRPLVDGAVLNAGAAFGFSAVLLADRLTPRWHWLGYTAATLGVVSVGFARIYTDTGELLGVAFSLVLVLAWLVLVGVAYRRHRPEDSTVPGLSWGLPAGLALLVAVLGHSHSLEEFRHETPRVAVAAAEWRDRGWSRLPAWRMGTFGHPDQPLAVQWAAPLDDIRAVLGRNGWREAPAWSLARALHALAPRAGIADLPVLPHFNQTEADALRLIKPAGGGRWLLVRFWPSGWVLEGEGTPIWLVGVAFLEAREFLGLVRFSGERTDDGAAVERFVNELRAIRAVRVETAADGRRVALVWR
jgi:membrane protein DedA with SNARE-associated domain